MKEQNNNLKEQYNKPTIEVIEFNAEDIITTSGGGCYGVCNSDCNVVF